MRAELKRFLFFLMLFSGISINSAQTSSELTQAISIYDLIPEASPVTFQRPEKTVLHEYGFTGTDAGTLITESFLHLYWITFSDVDGEHCPFSPSCSEYLRITVRESGLIEGMLKFADRFTRDVTPIKTGLYPVKHGKLYDPPVRDSALCVH